MLDNTILANLILNDEYAKKVIPFLREDYFFDTEQKVVFDLISKYVHKYSAFPTKEALFIDLSNITSLNEAMYDKVQQVISGLETDPETQIDFLIDQTESFCKQKAMENAIRQSISILDDKTGKTTATAIPKLVQDALAVSFDASVGHDFLDDFESRYELYHRVENKIPFDIEILNRITKGGVSRKTLNLFMAACVHPDTKVKIRIRKRA
jgi:hypothetical protein